MNDLRPTYASMPPESWRPARRIAMSVAGPIERFIHIEAASGIVLLVAAILALGWANSPWGETYEHFWHTPFSVGIGEWVFEESLHFVINDLLMAIFFLLVGLEIKREITEGALSEVKRAALPIAAALGGMLVPAVLYGALNSPPQAHRGWGVPMATDIAFAVGVLTLLGRRVPAALRVLLLAIAIIDDIGAILVIAIFYSAGFHPAGLVPLGMGLLGIIALQSFGVRYALAYIPAGLAMVVGMIQLGVHPSIAGVIAGLMTPARSWFGEAGFLAVAESALHDFQQRASDPEHDEHDLIQPLNRLAVARREALSPARRVESILHPWVAYGIMPLFALANAGVSLRGMHLNDATAVTVLLGISLGLVVGKPLGIVGLSWLSVRLGFSALPPGVTWKGLFVLGAAGGIGFTMAIFISELAFAGTDLSGAGKLAVLLGTTVAGAVSYGAGRFLLPHEQPDAIHAISASDLEASTEYWTTEDQEPRQGFQVKM